MAKPFAEARNPASTTPATPSGPLQVYEKPAISPRNDGSGTKKGIWAMVGSGQSGSTITRNINFLAVPHCQGRLKRLGETYTRCVKEVYPKISAPQATEHTIHRDWCPRSEDSITQQVPDALPNARLGNRTMVPSATWMHYGLAQITNASVK